MLRYLSFSFLEMEWSFIVLSVESLWKDYKSLIQNKLLNWLLLEDSTVFSWSWLLLYESSLFDGVFRFIFNCTCWLYDSFLYWIL